MPTYQYSCTECGHFLEQFQNFTDDALTECPECGGRLRKVFNAVGVVFKGSGFYRNDSRSADAGAGGASTGKADSSTQSGFGHRRHLPGRLFLGRLFLGRIEWVGVRKVRAGDRRLGQRVGIHLRQASGIRLRKLLSPPGDEK